MDSLGYDPQRFAMDYHIIGFRECAAEVARYLVTIEGMDIQDPLRLRLMSHLQYFVQQREMSKGCPVSPGATWAAHTAAHPSTAAAAAAAYQPNCGVTPYQTYPSTTTTSHVTVSSSYVPNLPATLHQYPTLSPSPNAANMHSQQQQQQQQHGMTQQQQQQHTVRSTSVGSAQDTLPLMNHATVPTQQQQPQTQPQQQVTHPQHTPTSHDAQQQQQQQSQMTGNPTTHHSYSQNHTQDHTQHQSGSTYIELTSAHTHNSHRQTTPTVPSSSLGYTSMPPQYPVSVGQEYNHQSGVYVTANGSKPYRPWGAEMAY